MSWSEVTCLTYFPHATSLQFQECQPSLKIRHGELQRKRDNACNPRGMHSLCWFQSIGSCGLLTVGFTPFRRGTPMPLNLKNM